MYRVVLFITLTDVLEWVSVPEPAEDSCRVLPNSQEGRPSTWTMRRDCNPRLGEATLPSSGQKPQRNNKCQDLTDVTFDSISHKLLSNIRNKCVISR